MLGTQALSSDDLLQSESSQEGYHFPMIVLIHTCRLYKNVRLGFSGWMEVFA
jgi:hypothetical protein